LTIRKAAPTVGWADGKHAQNYHLIEGKIQVQEEGNGCVHVYVNPDEASGAS